MYSREDFESDCADLRRRPRRESVSCFDGMCGAFDCPKCRPGCKEEEAEEKEEAEE